MVGQVVLGAGQDSFHSRIMRSYPGSDEGSVLEISPPKHVLGRAQADGSRGLVNWTSCHVRDGNGGGSGGNLVVVVKTRQERWRKQIGLLSACGQICDLKLLIAPAHNLDCYSLPQRCIAVVCNGYCYHAEAAIALPQQ